MFKKTAVSFVSAVFAAQAQTTILVDFDTAGNWSSSGSLTSYQTYHSYAESGWSFTGGPALRQTTTAQDGVAGALGTYAWRLRDAAVTWTAIHTAALEPGEYFSAFGFDARRWDGTPSPAYTVDYSFNGGTTWSNFTTINNTALGNASSWKTFTNAVVSATGLAANQFVVRFSASSGERIMVDNFFSETRMEESGAAVQDVLGFDAVAAGAGQIDLAWTLNTNSDAVVVARSTDGTFGAPVAGTAYGLGDSIPGGGTVAYAGVGTMYQDSGLAVDSEYFYQIWSVDADANYSAGVAGSALASSYREGIRIIHVNDVHSRLTPHDYDITGIDDVPVLEKVGGAAYMTTKMLELAAAEPGSVIVDAGDVSEGNVLGDLDGNRGLIEFYNELDRKLKLLRGRGLDASVVGNHDVRHIDMLNNMKNLADFPFISMNIVHEGTTTPYFDPYVTVVADGKKVGILGYTTDTSSHLEETTVNVIDVLTCSWNNPASDIQIKDYVDFLRNEENCDMVLLLAHVGHSRVASDRTYSGYEDYQLIEDDGQTEPPDVVVGGHWHTMTETVWQPSDINHKTIIAEAASYCQYIGEIDLTDDGDYVDAWKNVIRCEDITPDADVLNVISNLTADYNAAPHTKYGDTNVTYALDQVIGYSADELRLNKDKWFTHSEFPWAGDNTAGAWVADSMQWYIDTQTSDSCDLALQSGGGVRRDNAAGEITYLELYETYPWQDDNMVLIEATGQEIWDFIEEDHCGTSISQGWQVFADDGIIYKIEKDGVPISPTDTFHVAISKYMYAHDNDFSTGGWGDPTPIDYDYSIRQTMIDYTSQFDATNPMSVPGPRYVLNTGSAGRFRAVITLVDDANSEPNFENAFVRLLSATDDTVARRGGYVDETLVNEDGSIHHGHRLAEVMLYRSYLGFEEGRLANGTILDIEGEFGFHAGNPQFVDQNGIVADGVEFRIVGTNTALALPDFKGSIAEFWDEWHENRYVSFECVKSGNDTVEDREGTQITVYTEGAYDKMALPGNVGDMLVLSGIQTMRYDDRRFRCSEAVAVGAVDYTPVSAVDEISPALRSGHSLTLTATATDSSAQSSLSLLPVADAHVEDGNTGKNSGSSANMYIQSATTGASPYGDERIWTKFDLSGLPAGAGIESATLRLYCWGTSFATANLDADAHGSSIDSWIEGEITWANQPAYGSVLDTVTLVASTPYVWYEWDVTGFAQAEAAGDGQASFVVKANTEDSATRNSYAFDSKEYQSGSKGPFLEVEFSGATPVGGTVTNLTIYYRYASDGGSWGSWNVAGSAAGEPWSFVFNYPDGYGRYEFYSVATDNAGNVEPAPLLADASVRYVADADEDGVDDSWEMDFFGNLTNVTASSDFDRDGFFDSHEFRAGTNPTNAASLLAIIGLDSVPVASSNHFVIHWESATGKTYSVERAADLAAGFTNIASGVSATPPVNTVTDTVDNAESAFYRIKLEN